MNIAHTIEHYPIDRAVEIELFGASEYFWKSSLISHHDECGDRCRDTTCDKISDTRKTMYEPDNHESVDCSHGIGDYELYDRCWRMEYSSMKLCSKEDNSAQEYYSQSCYRSISIDKKSSYNGDKCTNIPKKLESGEFFRAVELHDTISIVIDADRETSKYRSRERSYMTEPTCLSIQEYERHEQPDPVAEYHKRAATSYPKSDRQTIKHRRGTSENR